MLAADVTTGEIRRFLTGPAGCEITAVTIAPDGRSLFISIQHPGEPASERSDPAAPRAISNWPDFRPDGRPRAATVVIRREDRADDRHLMHKNNRSGPVPTLLPTSSI